MQNLFKELGAYILGSILIVIGLAFLYIYLSAPDMEDQPGEMLIASLFLMASGVFSLPPVVEKIGARASRLLMLIFAVVSIVLAFMLFGTVDEEIEFMADKDRIEMQTIQRLKDIRIAQEGYLKIKGTYTDNFDSLLAFIRQPSIPIPWKSGDLHDSILQKTKDIQARYIVHRDSLPSLGLTVKKAVSKGYSVRDTTYASVYDQYFAPEVREKKGLVLLSLDSLPYNPHSGERFIMVTDIIEVGGGVKQPVILVKDPTPFGREGVKKDTLAFGSLTESTTSGNWGSR